MIKRFCFLIASVGLCLFVYAKEDKGITLNRASVVPVNLQCEYLENPLGIDITQPRLSWMLESMNPNERGQRQCAYEILVASTDKFLQKGKADLWKSKAGNLSESVNIVYKGKKLKSGQDCFWKVRVMDERGKWSDWSKPACWTMGLFSNDWNAKWIGSNDAVGIKFNAEVDNNMPDPLFRKTFSLPEIPRKAVIYVASVGYHELYVNGKKIGDDVLMPSVTNNKIRARYVTYDISPYLKSGQNVIALWLGVSWSIFPAYQTNDKPAAPIVLAQAEVSLHNGNHIQINTDETWKTHASPNTLLGYWDAHHFGGEKYDATQEINGWNEVDLDDSNWKSVAVFNPKLILSADKVDQNRLIQEIKPKSVKKIEEGVYHIDMGVNYAGWFEIELSGETGDHIQLFFSERENEASTFGLHSEYILGTDGKGTFRNRFNYMSGRWVQISGLRKEPALNQMRGWMIHPDYKRAADFECDQPLLNNIYNTTLWTFENLSLGNYVVDCPQRERRGYGDAVSTTRTALSNYQLGSFYTKWAEDWRDVQESNGNVPYTAPTYLGGGGPSWSGFCIMLPWEIYHQYGDKRILSESFPGIERWLAFIETKSEQNMLVRWGDKWSFLGDWQWPMARIERKKIEGEGKALGDTRETLFYNNCYWIYNLETAAKMADILGNGKGDIYRKRADLIRKTVHSSFFNSNDNSYVNGYPGYLAIALAVNLPPVELKQKVWERLDTEIMINRKGHIGAGISAGGFLLNTLLDNNRNDLIYAMAGKDDFPSWGDMLKRGTTTFYEDWECRMSGLHSSYLYIGSWFIEGLGGIRQPEAGFRNFVIEPWINRKEGPRKVQAHYDSLYGRIATNWSINNEGFILNVVIPPNTTAVLKLHDVNPESIRENGKTLTMAKGIRIKTIAGELVSLEIDPGNYQFTSLFK